MEELRRNWLQHWHRIIDSEIDADPTFDFDSAFNDPDGDFRMHFCTWGLSDDALFRCFQILPCGETLARRAIEMRNLYRANDMISEDAAVNYFQLGLRSFSRFTTDDELTKPVRVIHVTDDELNAMQTDRVAVLLEDVEWAIPSENAHAGSFLRETLYQLAHSYDIVDYVKWPLFPDPDSIDPYKPFAILGTTQTYFPLLDQNGPALFVVAKKTG